MNRVAIVLLFGVLLGAGGVSAATPGSQAPQDPAIQADVNRRLNDLAERVERLDTRRDRGTSGAVLFLFGAFCALWAQNTKRDPWLWFFLGAIFNVFAVFALLTKNREDNPLPVSDAGAVRWKWVGGVVLMVVLTFLFFYLTSRYR